MKLNSDDYSCPDGFCLRVLVHPLVAYGIWSIVKPNGDKSYVCVSTYRQANREPLFGEATHLVAYGKIGPTPAPTVYNWMEWDTQPLYNIHLKARTPVAAYVFAENLALRLTETDKDFIDLAIERIHEAQTKALIT